MEVDTFKAGETDVQENIKALEEAVLLARIKAGLETIKGRDYNYNRGRGH